jgi:hypothetical protein
VRTRELLRKIDLTLERMDEHMARGNEHMARGNEHMARGNEHMARGNRLMDEIRDELRLSREERREQHEENRREHRLNRAAWENNTRVLRELLLQREEDRKILERIEQGIHAQTQGLLHVLDELRGGRGPGAAPAS